MIDDLVGELRNRLDVAPDIATDDQLQHVLDVAAAAVDPWITPADVPPHPQQASIDEAIVQLAVKVWDAGVRGLIGVDQTGEWTVPSAAATPGMVRAVFGVLAPAMPTGGVAV